MSKGEIIWFNVIGVFAAVFLSIYWCPYGESILLRTLFLGSVIVWNLAVSFLAYETQRKAEDEV